jgi:hypothetical protein
MTAIVARVRAGGRRRRPWQLEDGSNTGVMPSNPPGSLPAKRAVLDTGDAGM